MRNIKLLIQYDGTSYSGWQKQPNASTIQNVIEIKLTKILQESIRLSAAGRTDSGVHAIGQVANFKTYNKLTCQQLIRAINSFLPKDIRIFQCEEIDQDFHSRFSAKKRQYKYVIYNDLICPPFIRNYVHFIKKPLDVEKLKSTLNQFIGEHDFHSLASVSDKSKSSVRTIYDIQIDKYESKIIVRITANGFLRKMVRMIIGISLDINLKNLPIEEITRVLSLKSRVKHRYPTAPAHGLYLNRVWY